MDSKSLDRLTKINALAAVDDDYGKMERDWKQSRKSVKLMWIHYPRRSETFCGVMPIWGS